jgi:NADPH-dependent ferric siderophore reductase
MTPVTKIGRSAVNTPGQFGKALIGLFMKRATVTAVYDIAYGFRLITLEGPKLQGVAWTPGQKIQIGMGSAFVARTYTPIEWDAAAGRTCILGYAHSDGPGSAWMLGIKIGDECDLFGPRNSLDVRHLNGPLVVFGDETSIGLAYALSRQDSGRSVVCQVEVDDLASAQHVRSTLDIGNVTVTARSDGDGHLAQLEASFPALVGTSSSFVLTGKAGSVQRLGRELKRQGVPANRIVGKAHWAPGKAGLD